MEQFVLHEIHIGRHMRKVCIIAFAQVIQTRFAIGSLGKTVLRALAVAGEKELTLTALARQGVTLLASEIQLTLTIKHGGERLFFDVA